MSALRCSRGVYPLLPFFVPRFRTQVQGPRIQLGQASNHPTGRVFLKVGPPKNMKAWLPFGCPKATNPKKGGTNSNKTTAPSDVRWLKPCAMRRIRLGLGLGFGSGLALVPSFEERFTNSFVGPGLFCFFFVFCCSVFLPLFFLSFCLCLFLSFFVFPSFGLCLSGFLAACLSVGLSSTN